ncbi:MAG TPA: aminopeptidase P N-terminal domain-containing protein [Myxococcales bacterium]|nr:aminopeptidase P N-terminal domain-containing protein [Myxococcales bacterium]
MPTTIAPVTPVLPVEVFAARRAEVMRRMRELVPGGGVLVLSATPVAIRNNDVEHPYRADSDLFWLTGFEEPEAVAVLEPAADKPFTLFVRPRDRDRETWTGRRAGVEGAQRAFGADRAFPVGELGARLPQLLEGRRALFHRFGGPDVEFDARIAKLIGVLRARARSGGGAPPRIEDPGQILHELRLRKAPEELSSLRRAVELTRRGHLLAMAKGRPGTHEYELQALLEREFRGGGGRGWGYYPIVAAGANGTVLHYHENNARAEAGELWLIDAGAEVDLYTADVTRTFPVSGRFTPAQRSAYELVLSAADACIAATRPGATIDGLHAQAIQVLVAGMIRLGLLRGEPNKLIEEGAFRRYYMHRTSHWLGLDVHDAGDYRDPAGAPRPLEPGMVFTVEPGLYVSPDDESAPPELRGLGIRIEDDVLVTAAGYENLTAAIPRTVAEVEAACLT